MVIIVKGMLKFTGTGQGKFILMGEHAVVYGKPAIGTHLDRGIRVSLIESKSTAALPLEEKLGHLDEKGKKAYMSAARAAGIDPFRFRLAISSGLAVGQGLGSSAALSVAIARAILDAKGEKKTDKKVVNLAQTLETVFHGRPSGIDATIALGKGPLLYRKGRPAVKVRVGIPIPVVVLMSGTSPATKVMVGRVRKKYEKNRDKISALINEIENLTLSALPLIRKGALKDLGALMNENHRILKKLGVSAKIIDNLREKALKAGAVGAKLTGGGGGGSVICLAEEKKHAKEILKKLNMEKNSFITIIE